MRSALNSGTAWATAFLFIFGMLCVSVSKPGIASASMVSGCAKKKAEGNAGCHMPIYFCDPSAAAGIIGPSLATPKPRESFKKSHLPAVDLFFSLFSKISPGILQIQSAGILGNSTRLPVYLFNSVLTL